MDDLSIHAKDEKQKTASENYPAELLFDSSMLAVETSISPYSILTRGDSYLGAIFKDESTLAGTQEVHNEIFLNKLYMVKDPATTMAVISVLTSSRGA